MHELLIRKPETISLSEISSNPGPTTMSFGYDPAPLQHSISNVGMVNMPIVRMETNAKATIIAGFRRICAAKALGWKTISCRVVSRSEMGDFEGLMINLYDNLTVRTLNEVEKGMLLSRLSTHLGTEEILSRFMPLLGMASHYPIYHLYLQLEKGLSMEDKEYLARGSVSLAALKAAMSVEPISRHALIQTLHKLGFNINQQIQFVDYMLDLSNAHQKDILEMLREPPLGDLCEQSSINRPQKAREILSYLRSIRFPRMIQVEQRFKTWVSQLDLPKGVRIEPPPYFEGSETKMEIRFTNGRELKKKVDDLARLKTLETLGSSWEADHDE
jgi:hypothetical protein